MVSLYVEISNESVLDHFSSSFIGPKMVISYSDFILTRQMIYRYLTKILFAKILRIGIRKIGRCLKLSFCFSDEIDSVFANMADFYFGAVSIGKCDLRLLLKIGDTG